MHINDIIKRKELLDVFLKDIDKMLGSSGEGIITSSWSEGNSSTRRQHLKWMLKTISLDCKDGENKLIIISLNVECV